MSVDDVDSILAAAPSLFIFQSSMFTDEVSITRSTTCRIGPACKVRSFISFEQFLPSVFPSSSYRCSIQAIIKKMMSSYMTFAHVILHQIVEGRKFTKKTILSLFTFSVQSLPVLAFFSSAHLIRQESCSAPIIPNARTSQSEHFSFTNVPQICEFLSTANTGKHTKPDSNHEQREVA